MATTKEQLTALALVLDATHQHAAWQSGQRGVPNMDMTTFVKVTRLFTAIVGQPVADRLAKWFEDTQATPEDARRIAFDPQQTELKMLASVIGIGQQA